MKVIITAKKMNLSDSFQEYAQKKLDSKLDKFFGHEAEAQIVLKEFKSEIIVEVTVKYNSMIYRSEQRAADKRDALDACIDKIIRQIRKNKTKVEKKLRENAFDASSIEDDVKEEQSKITRHKTFVMHPMTEEEAVLQMELLDHEFYMFLNAETGKTNVVYRRSGGDYAVLIPADM